jgi:type I restriction enzyme S subunit
VIVRLKDVVATNRETLPETTDPDFTFRYVDIGAVSQGRIAVPDSEQRFGIAPSRARRVAEPGDTVVSTVRTYLRAVARVPETVEPLVFSTGFAVLHPHEDRIDSRYLSYFCTSSPFIESVVTRSVGVSYPAINASEVTDIHVDLPLLDEQRRIADFLDTETARLDRLIDLRKRQATAVVDRTQRELDDLFVTSNARRTRLKYLLRQRISYGVLVPRFVDVGGVRLIRVNDLANLPSRADGLSQIERIQSLEYGRTVVAAGDLLISVVGTVGRAALVLHSAAGANLARAVARLQPVHGVDSMLLWQWTQSADFKRQITLVTEGDTAQPTLNVGDLSNFSLALPTDRHALASLTTRAGLAIRVRDDLIAACTKQASLLAERRQALITAAVTGQLDLTTARGLSA